MKSQTYLKLFSFTAALSNICFAGSPSVDLDFLLISLQKDFGQASVPTDTDLALGSKWNCSFFSAQIGSPMTAIFESSKKFKELSPKKIFQMTSDRYGDTAFNSTPGSLLGSCAPSDMACSTLLSIRSFESNLMIEEMLLENIPSSLETNSERAQTRKYVDPSVTIPSLKVSGYFVCHLSSTPPTVSPISSGSLHAIDEVEPISVDIVQDENTLYLSRLIQELMTEQDPRIKLELFNQAVPIMSGIISTQSSQVLRPELQPLAEALQSTYWALAEERENLFFMSFFHPGTTHVETSEDPKWVLEQLTTADRIYHDAFQFAQITKNGAAAQLAVSKREFLQTWIISFDRFQDYFVKLKEVQKLKTLQEPQNGGKTLEELLHTPLQGNHMYQSPTLLQVRLHREFDLILLRIAEIREILQALRILDSLNQIKLENRMASLRASMKKFRTTFYAVKKLFENHPRLIHAHERLPDIVRIEYNQLIAEKSAKTRGLKKRKIREETSQFQAVSASPAISDSANPDLLELPFPTSLFEPSSAPDLSQEDLQSIEILLTEASPSTEPIRAVRIERLSHLKLLDAYLQLAQEYLDRSNLSFSLFSNDPEVSLAEPQWAENQLHLSLSTLKEAKEFATPVQLEKVNLIHTKIQWLEQFLKEFNHHKKILIAIREVHELRRNHGDTDEVSSKLELVKKDLMQVYNQARYPVAIILRAYHRFLLGSNKASFLLKKLQQDELTHENAKTLLRAIRVLYYDSRDQFRAIKSIMEQIGFKPSPDFEEMLKRIDLQSNDLGVLVQEHFSKKKSKKNPTTESEL